MENTNRDTMEDTEIITEIIITTIIEIETLKIIIRAEITITETIIITTNRDITTIIEEISNNKTLNSRTKKLSPFFENPYYNNYSI